jgi:hypothetical protein
MSVAAAAESIALPAAALGGPGPADPARCAQAVIEVLTPVAGPGMRLSSLTLDVAAQPLGAGAITIRTHVDKKTRAILFISLEARAEDALVFSAQGLFSKTGGTP